MKKLNNTYIDSLLTKILNETIQERADELASKITDKGKKSKKFPDLTGDGEITYADILKGRGVEIEEGSEVCEQCGGSMNEGICEQCSTESMEEGLYDVSGKFPKHQSFDYVQEEDEENIDFEMMGVDDDNDPLDRIERFCNTESEDYSEQTCKFHKSMVTEKLHGGQKFLDKNKNKRLDTDDFRLLRKSKKRQTDEEVEEGNAFTGALSKAKEEGKHNFTVDGKKFKVKESIKLTETEMIDLIERIVKEDNLKVTTKPKGMVTYEKAFKGSGKENNDYLKSVTKKMKDYLKDGSKGEYSMEPKIFPKGNGELAKMDKMAYVPDEPTKEYTDNFTAAGLENLVYDEIHPNEEWVNDNIEGSSRTGNNPKWANTGESDVNKKRNKIRKDNLLGAVKQMAYNKAPQPVVDDTGKGVQGKFEKNFGKDAGKKSTKILNKLEYVEEKEKKQINEEFERMKNLISYNQKTQ